MYEKLLILFSNVKKISLTIIKFMLLTSFLSFEPKAHLSQRLISLRLKLMADPTLHHENVSFFFHNFTHNLNPPKQRLTSEADRS